MKLKLLSSNHSSVCFLSQVNEPNPIFLGMNLIVLPAANLREGQLITDKHTLALLSLRPFLFPSNPSRALIRIERHIWPAIRIQRNTSIVI